MDPTASFWDERFRGEEYVYGVEPNDFLAAEAGRLPAGGRVLSLGEGEGRNAVFLAGRGHPVVAVDGSREGLRKAERLAAARGVAIETVQADLAAYAPVAGSFAGVVSVFCHLPPAVRAAALGRAVAALAPSGVLLLEAYTPRQLALGTGGPKDVDLLVEPAALRAELVGLDLVVLREVERELHEGRLHQGRSAVVQAVGVRRGPGGLPAGEPPRDVRVDSRAGGSMTSASSHPLAGSTLFVSARSPFARRVRVAFLEAGVPFVERVVDVMAPSDELIAANPLARVPALRTPSGDVLVESTLILAHLWDGLGAAGERLRPRDPAARRRDDLVSGLAVGLCDKAVEWFFEHTRPEAHRDPVVLDEVRACAARTLATLEAACAARAVTTGAEPSAADLDLAIALTYHDLRVDRAWKARHPRLAAVQARLEARDSLRRTAPPPPA